MFASVWNTLAQKKCVAIFPEGGSHDQSNFLPFKAGVSIMSLGFLDHYPDSEFYLIPVGMNYFKRDSFREYSFLLFSFSLAERALFWISASPSRWIASWCGDSIRAARRSTRP